MWIRIVPMFHGSPTLFETLPFRVLSIFLKWWFEIYCSEMFTKTEVISG